MFQAGDPGDAAYLIDRGEVEVLIGAAGELRRVNRLGTGEIFGEFALLDGKPRTATVRTTAETELTRIDRGHLDSLLAQADPVIRYLLQALVASLRRGDALRKTAAAATNPTEAAQSGHSPADASTAGHTPSSTPPPFLAGATTSVQTTPSGTTSPAEATTSQDLAIAEALRRDAQRTLSLAQNLSDALDARQLALHYQPIVDLQTGALAGYEALIRWRHPVLGMVRPDEFIPLAERTALISRVGLFVMEQALEDWISGLRTCCSAAGGRKPFISINLSAQELCQPEIVTTVQARLEKLGVPAPELRIELTETSVISSVDSVSAVIGELRDLGVGIALDDFGKGYAGLDTLQSLPFSCLKIDKSFVDRIFSSERSLEIIRSALDLARLLGMSTVAEGIEDAPTAARLLEMGCVYGQGYHFAKPMPAEAMPGWVAGR